VNEQLARMAQAGQTFERAARPGNRQVAHLASRASTTLHLDQLVVGPEGAVE
jgi:hypothetical protein